MGHLRRLHAKQVAQGGDDGEGCSRTARLLKEVGDRPGTTHNGSDLIALARQTSTMGPKLVNMIKVFLASCKTRSRCEVS